MSERLNGAYWKLWHDGKSRFFLALGLMLLMLFGVLTVGSSTKPRACVDVDTDMSWSVYRQQLVTNYEYVKSHGYLENWGRQHTLGEHPDVANPLQIKDADVLATHCATGQWPNIHYAWNAQLYRQTVADSGWSGLTYLFIFLGILISVGPPFSGESHEAFSLTFSLPWSRERWLINKLTMSCVMVMALFIVAVIIIGTGTHFRFMDQMQGGYPVDMIANTMRMDVHPLNALLAGLVGISLGTVASLFSRNVLNAAVAACLAAYLLISVRYEMPVGGGIKAEVLPIITSGNVVTALLVVSIAGLIILTRLRTTDY